VAAAATRIARLTIVPLSPTPLGPLPRPARLPSPASEMIRHRPGFNKLTCALTVLTAWSSASLDAARAQDNVAEFAFIGKAQAGDDSAVPVVQWAVPRDTPQDGIETAPLAEEIWLPPPMNQLSPTDDDDPLPGMPRMALPLIDNVAPDEWCWQVLPAGLIYHSYLAGPHEPRISLTSFQERDDRTLWDATLAGRAGVFRFGNRDPLCPQGLQVDIYGGAVVRLDIENRHDLESSDYIFGIPVTYGVGSWQFKFVYAHVSSHLGDERAIRVPGTLAERINYVRDEFVLGASYFPHPIWRVYGEAGWAFHLGGGAEPWEFQFGSECSLPGPTGQLGSPFLAVNGRLRQEHDFGGDLTAQAGWLWRGEFGHTMRIGAQYFNGKSSQFQSIDDSEEQVGMGLWYDF